MRLKSLNLSRHVAVVWGSSTHVRSHVHGTVYPQTLASEEPADSNKPCRLRTCVCMYCFDLFSWMSPSEPHRCVRLVCIGIQCSPRSSYLCCPFFRTEPLIPAGSTDRRLRAFNGRGAPRSLSSYVVLNVQAANQLRGSARLYSCIKYRRLQVSI
jgi:hypothetical protein